MALIRFICAGLIAATGVVLADRHPQQSQQAPPPPQFRSTTDLVLLDVSVIDKSRKPVRGLTAADFTVLDDGVPQTIATFAAIDLPNPEAPSARWMNRAPLDVQTNRMPGGRLVLIYMDERQMTASPFGARAAIETGHAIVDQLSPDDVAAVGFAVDHRGAQEFTADHGRLHAAIDTYAPTQPIGFSVLGTLRDLCQLLGAIPERRKILIYIGPGQGYDLEVLATMERVTGTSSGTNNLTRPEQQTQYTNMLSLFSVAQRANVSLYMIDPNGLDGGNPSAPNKEFMRVVANTTGGRAIVGNNAPASQVPVILNENASYYLLTFRSSGTGSTGKFRRVEVKVNRPGVEVRSRRGYIEGRTGGATVAAGVNPALGRLIPATQLELGLWAAPVGSDPSGSHPVALVINVGLPRAGAPRSEHVAVAYSIVDMSGKERASGREDLVVSPPAGEAPVYLASAEAVAALPPGKYDIRVSAQSVERNRRGGLLGDVVVPDFAKEALSLSGLVLSEKADARPEPNDLRTLIGAMPTTDRVWAASAVVGASARVYQAKLPLAPVTVKVTVIDARDKTAFESSERLAPEAFAAGSADYRFPLPLARLGPGEFLLRLEASRSGAQPVKREIRFRVE
jgi:VWFA-related protein